MSLQSAISQKHLKLSPAVTSTSNSIWERVVWDWMREVGNSKEFASLLHQEEAAFRKLAIQYEWFEFEQGLEMRVVGVCFHLPFDAEPLAFFQERYTAFDGVTTYTWHAISMEQYQTFYQKSIRLTPLGLALVPLEKDTI